VAIERANYRGNEESNSADDVRYCGIYTLEELSEEELDRWIKIVSAAKARASKDRGYDLLDPMRICYSYCTPEEIAEIELF
jgi:hypothetical protein